MKKHLKIKVADCFSELLNTREAAVILFENTNEKVLSILEFDFENVEFVSRSFADQFYKERLKFEQEKNLQIILTNVEPAIHKVFQTVEQTQNKMERNYVKLPVFKYSSSSLLSDYLLSV